jgi:methylglutaconyl-CoA hydratase
MSDSLVLIDNHDPQITIVTLNRADKRNALSIALMDQLTAAFAAAANDPNRRAIVLRAEGPSFCAGLDLTEASDPANSHRSAKAAAKMYLAITTSPLIAVAAARGAAVGGGAGLVLACDFGIAGDDLRIGFPEVHRGLVAALVTTLLRRQMNERTARELILLGQTISAERAMTLGLIHQIAPADDVTGTAVAFAREASQAAPGAIARTKKLLDSLNARTIEEDLQRALAFHLQARNSSEAAEGMAAFLEKRDPNWPPRQED